MFDIVDTGGLNIGRDELKDRVFLYASNLELKGKEVPCEKADRVRDYLLRFSGRF